MKENHIFMKEFLSILIDFNEAMNEDSIISTTGSIQNFINIKLMEKFFWQDMDRINPLTNLSDDDILIAIRNWLGVEQRLAIHNKVARILVKKQIPIMYYPCKRFCLNVFKKMQILIRFGDNHKLNRFPILMENIIRVMDDLLNQNKQKADNIIEEIFAAEWSYINFDHKYVYQLRSFIAGLLDDNKTKIIFDFLGVNAEYPKNDKDVRNRNWLNEANIEEEGDYFQTNVEENMNGSPDPNDYSD